MLSINLDFSGLIVVFRRWFYIGSRLGKKKEFEIRTRFEYGENLKDLAIIYKVPIRTLEERKKKSEYKGDPWIKGYRAKSHYQSEIEINEEKKAIILKEITNDARVEFIKATAILKEFYKDSSIISLPKIEEAYLIRVNRINKQLKIRKEIENILPIEAQLNLDLLKANIKLKKLEAEKKSAELETTNISLKLAKKKAEHYLK